MDGGGVAEMDACMATGEACLSPTNSAFAPASEIEEERHISAGRMACLVGLLP